MCSTGCGACRARRSRSRSPSGSRLSLPTWIRVVRTSWIGGDRDVEERDDGIRVATPLRMLFGLAAQFNQHRFERAAEDVWHKELVSPDDAREYLELIRRSGAPVCAG